ncbi:Divergent polysaccharide deacetylase [Pseudoruegeria aquimaris]|uniref:Divergent polysaccharide deacetylase n=1 Tax=Pseudoruegeria aquimaris TaxID=393663 RepID=A0A1Y5SJK0_9RHOB|nr:divergent polysaccharide deacetylase family protein [Pseudoruegeria aquimaris]SLN41091.1 Divergent polysaccharide deacetylase [Pseudoruegeria aquimaris]
MLRGLLEGVFWGVVVSAVIAGFFLVLSDVRLLSTPNAPVGAIERPAGEVSAPESGAEAVADVQGAPGGQATGSAQAPKAGAPAAPATGAPETPALGAGTTEPLARPDLAEPEVALSVPEGSEGEPAPAAPSAAADGTTAPKEGPLPSVPAADTPLDMPLSAEAPQAPQPQGGAAAPQAPSEDEATADAPEAPQEATDAPALAAAPEAPETAPGAAAPDALPEGDPGAQAQAPQAGAGPELTPTAEAGESRPEDVAVLDRPTPSAMPGRPAAPLGGGSSPRLPVAPQAPEAPGDAADAPIRVPVEDIGNLAPQVRTNRLPTISRAGQPEAGAAQGAAGEAAEGVAAQAAPAGESLPALKAFAEPFEDDPTLPRMSVVLIDDGSGAVDPQAFAGFPLPLAFAIDPRRPDAAAAAYDYRAAGFEVVMLTEFAAGTDPSEVEVAMEAYRQAVPEAVAVFDTGANGAMADRALIQQLVAIARGNGMGVLSSPRGLNAAQQIAERQGVPAALVFRTFDGDGQSISTMKRYLNRAAFKAAQEGEVVMVGHTRADTIKALVEWVLDDRSSSVALAPVSAVLMNE